jgi:hypothetical protein
LVFFRISEILFRNEKFELAVKDLGFFVHFQFLKIKHKGGV